MHKQGPKDQPRLTRRAGRDVWYIYHKRHYHSTGTTSRTEAESALAIYREEKARRTGAVITVAEVLSRYLADREARAIPGLARLRYAHQPLTRLLGRLPPDALDDEGFRSYSRHRQREGVTAATVRTELQALRAALLWAAGKRNKTPL